MNDDQNRKSEGSLRKMEEMLDRRFSAQQEIIERRLGVQATRGANRWFILLLFVLLLFGGMFAIVFLQFRNLNQKLDHVERRPPQRVPAAPDSERVAALNSRLDSLEQLQEAMVSNSKGALEQMNFVFGIAAALVGVFGLYSLYRQSVAEAGRDRHEEEMRGLVGSFRDNMTSINSLIGTLEASFRHRATVDSHIDTINKQLEDINQFKTGIEKSLNERLIDLNSAAFSLFQELMRDPGQSREVFKSEENRGRLEHFYVTMNALERMGDVKSRFSPISYFIRALHFFNATQYKPASADLEDARRTCSHQIAEPTTAWYQNSPINEIIEALKRMERECFYHLGIIYYNVGEYSKARERFAEAYQRDPLDLRSRAYIPELMFFEAREPFERVISEFEAVEREFDRLQTSQGRGKINLDSHMAGLLMRKGNCYLPKAILLVGREKYRVKERAEEALTLYEKAHEYARRTITTPGKPPLTEIFVRWSIAQALKAARRSDWHAQPRNEVFRNVFSEVRKQVALKTEPIVLALFNYVLSICVHDGNIENESASFYLSRAREHLQRVPTDVRVFSPINKINLSREELLGEMEEFEAELN